MKEENENVQKNTSNVNSVNRYTFDFEQYTWNSKQVFKCDLAKNALQKIEEERLNIEKDLKILESIKQEKSNQIKLMVSLLQTKEELENKIKFSTNI